MQSSAVVTLRALVMLLCLVLVPLAAIFGSGLPKVFNSLMQGGGVPHFARVRNEADDARARGGDAPIFAARAADVSTAEPAALPGHPDGTGSLWAPHAVAPADTNRSPPAEVQSSPSSQRSPLGADQSSTVLVGGAGPTNVAPTANAGFEQIEHRLRDLGATYYLLETWGTTNQQYRFHCKIPAPGNPQDTQQFDATDDDPIRAMRRVLEQVEQYRTGSQP
ncbi:MAG TPA: hypothetical protein VGG64_11020 [Pirellulales bacterium]